MGFYNDLFDIGLKIKDVLENPDEETGEIDAVAYNELDMAKNEKLESIGLYIKNLKAEEEILSNEIEKMRKKKEAVEKHIDRLKEFYKFVLDGDKFKSPLVNVYYSNTSALVVDDVSQIPAEYVKYTIPTINKTQLKKDIESGKTLSGCHVEEHQNIVVK